MFPDWGNCLGVQNVTMVRSADCGKWLCCQTGASA